VFHKSDADLLKLLEGIPMGDFSLGDNQIKGLSVTLAPEEAKRDDFHYRLSLDQQTFLGIQSDDLLLTGSGKIHHGTDSENGEDFTISGPVSQFKVVFNINE
jgi:hypothetical protein